MWKNVLHLENKRNKRKNTLQVHIIYELKEIEEEHGGLTKQYNLGSGSISGRVNYKLKSRLLFSRMCM